MSRRFVQELKDGDAIEDVYQVTDKQRRVNRNGNYYLQVELRDRSGAISARLWNAGESLFRAFDVGDYVLARGKVQLFQGALQVILSHVERSEADQVDPGDFLPRTTQDLGKLRERLHDYLLHLGNPHLRALAECFLMDEEFMRGFCRAPAGVRVHHAYIGGLLEHVVTLMDAAERILPLYLRLDRDLLLAGIFLHDAGKVRELTHDKVFTYSDEGQLLGHLVIGVELLTEKAARVPDLTGEPFPPELLLRLKHMIVSHHGTHEFGSPKVPMTPEAIALHYLDNLDAKVHSFTRDISDDTNQSSAWTQFSPTLQRRLFKGTANGAEAGCPPPAEPTE
jgi:3'-5' exoribonuclease